MTTNIVLSGISLPFKTEVLQGDRVCIVSYIGVLFSILRDFLHQGGILLDYKREKKKISEEEKEEKRRWKN